jgi:hypothetical protein
MRWKHALGFGLDARIVGAGMGKTVVEITERVEATYRNRYVLVGSDGGRIVGSVSGHGHSRRDPGSAALGDVEAMRWMTILDHMEAKGLDLSNREGGVAWRTELPGVADSATAIGDTVLVGLRDSDVMVAALERETGRILWSMPRQEGEWAWRDARGVLGDTSMVLTRRLASGTTVVRVDDGMCRWQVSVPKAIAIQFASGSFSDSVVAVVTYAVPGGRRKAFLVLNAETGERIAYCELHHEFQSLGTFVVNDVLALPLQWAIEWPQPRGGPWRVYLYRLDSLAASSVSGECVAGGAP